MTLNFIIDIELRRLPLFPPWVAQIRSLQLWCVAFLLVAVALEPTCCRTDVTIEGGS